MSFAQVPFSQPAFRPGWYPTPPHGQLRWWDGAQWGPFAAPPPPPPLTPSDAHLWAALSHACFFVLGMLGPFLIRETKGKIVTGSPQEWYLRNQATEALNFQISFMIVWLLGIFAWISGSMLLSVALPPVGFLIAICLWAGLLGCWIVGVVYAVLALTRTSGGRPWRYPITWRFVGL